MTTSLGITLRRFRLKQGYTSITLADLAAVNRSHLSDIENGKVKCSIEIMYRLCVAMKVEPWRVMRAACKGLL